jgi:hypothetical protein
MYRHSLATLGFSKRDFARPFTVLKMYRHQENKHLLFLFIQDKVKEGGDLKSLRIQNKKFMSEHKTAILIAGSIVLSPCSGCEQEDLKV